MRTTRVIGSGVRGMGRNRLRTFFMVLATLVGVAALTVTMAIGEGTQRDLLDRLDRMLGGSSILLRAGGGQMRGGAHGGSGPATTLTLDDMRAIEDEVPAVEYVDPIMAANLDVAHDGQSMRIRVEGHGEAAEIVWDRSVTRGAYITQADVASAARIALVGEVVVRDLFGGRDPIGAQIRIGNVPFQVIGVLAPAGADPHGMDKDNEILIPVTTMMRRVLNVDYIVNAKLGLHERADVEAVAGEVRTILRARHGLGPDVPDDFGIFTPVQVQHVVRSANRTFTVFLPLVAGVSILVACFVVANLMLMNVHERRTEIGLRKAVGARPRDIRLQFFVEAAAVTALGGLLAVALAYGILQMIALHGAIPSGMPWQPALVGLAAAIVVGIVSGVAPARRAAALDPVLTLR